MALLCTLDDVKRLLRDRSALGGEKIRIGSTEDDHITISDANKYIEAETHYIIGRLKRDPGGNPLIRDVCASLTCYRLWIHIIVGGQGGDIPEFVKEWNRWAEDILDKFADGSIATGVEPPEGNLAARSSNWSEVRWEKIELDGTDFGSLDNQEIILGSLKVFKDKAESDVYQEFYDYQISYRTGEIRRLSTGRITDGQEVYVSYCYLKPRMIREIHPSVQWDKRTVNDYGREH